MGKLIIKKIPDRVLWGSVDCSKVLVGSEQVWPIKQLMFNLYVDGVLLDSKPYDNSYYIGFLTYGDCNFIKINSEKVHFEFFSVNSYYLDKYVIHYNGGTTVNKPSGYFTINLNTMSEIDIMLGSTDIPTPPSTTLKIKVNGTEVSSEIIVLENGDIVTPYGILNVNIYNASGGDRAELTWTSEPEYSYGDSKFTVSKMNGDEYDVPITNYIDEDARQMGHVTISLYTEIPTIPLLIYVDNVLKSTENMALTTGSGSTQYGTISLTQSGNYFTTSWTLSSTQATKYQLDRMVIVKKDGTTSTNATFNSADTSSIKVYLKQKPDGYIKVKYTGGEQLGFGEFFAEFYDGDTDLGRLTPEMLFDYLEDHASVLSNLAGYARYVDGLIVDRIQIVLKATRQDTHCVLEFAEYLDGEFAVANSIWLDVRQILDPTIEMKQETYSYIALTVDRAEYHTGLWEI